MSVRNIDIARPRKQNARKNKAKSVNATFSNPNSVMNSMFNFQIITKRTTETYDLNGCILKNDKDVKKHNQSRMEANVGQMDRLNRLKANNKSCNK